MNFNGYKVCKCTKILFPFFFVQEGFIPGILFPFIVSQVPFRCFSQSLWYKYYSFSSRALSPSAPCRLLGGYELLDL